MREGFPTVPSWLLIHPPDARWRCMFSQAGDSRSGIMQISGVVQRQRGAYQDSGSVSRPLLLSEQLVPMFSTLTTRGSHVPRLSISVIPTRALESALSVPAARLNCVLIHRNPRKRTRALLRAPAARSLTPPPLSQLSRRYFKASPTSKNVDS